MGTSSLLRRFIIIFIYGIFEGSSYTKGTPTDVPPQCPPIPTFAHGHTNSYHNGYVIYYFCDWGYVLFGVESLHCGNDGRWSDTPPVCVGTSGCRILPRLTNGHTSYAYKGGVATFECDMGYTLRGLSVVYCDGAQWNAAPPECQPKNVILKTLPVSNCPFPPLVANASMEINDLDVIYTCQGGTEPTMGSERLECGLNGQWKTSPVICAKIGCILPNPPSNGLIIRKFSNAFMEFRCYDNFVLQGPSLAFCDGFKWNMTSPTSCVPANTAFLDPPTIRPLVIGGTRCMNAPIVPNSMMQYQRLKDSRGVMYWTAKYTCNDRYNLRPGYSYVYCSDGQWVGHVACVLSSNTQNSRNLNSITT